jgi:hypothetical protein
MSIGHPVNQNRFPAYRHSRSTRALPPLRAQDLPRFLLAFTFVYLAACNFKPFWIGSDSTLPVTALPVEIFGVEDELRLTRVIHSEREARSQKNQTRESLSLSEKTSASSNLPKPRRIFIELPTEKIRLNPRANAPPTA